ncbi:MAG: hypothetical protein M5U19_05515 [Microthrixaceae bacterium]|nr:hypothetical protein [Microthrixaceae bacterium]
MADLGVIARRTRVSPVPRGLRGCVEHLEVLGGPDSAAYYLEVIANERDDHYLGSGRRPGGGSVGERAAPG